MKDNMLIHELKRYKALHYMTNEDIGVMIRMHKTAVAKLLKLNYPVSDNIRFRIEELLRTGDANKAVNNEGTQKAYQTNVDKNKTTKMNINRKVQNHTVDKVSHKNPPKKRSRVS